MDSGSRQSFSRSEVAFGHTTSVMTSRLLQPLHLTVDASALALAIGATLFQVYDMERPICWISKKLDKHQKRYSTVGREALELAVQSFIVYFGSDVVIVYRP